MVKEFEDYIPFLKEKFPDISEESLREVVRTGISQLQYFLNRNMDVCILKRANKDGSMRANFVRPVTNYHKRNFRAMKAWKKLQRIRKQRGEYAAKSNK